MLGILGILGCLGAIAIGVTAVCTAVSVYVSYDQADDAKEAAQKAMDQQEDALREQEKQQEFFSKLNKKIAERNRIKMEGQLGSQVALNHIHANWARDKANLKRFLKPPKPRPSYNNYGTPKPTSPN